MKYIIFISVLMFVIGYIYGNHQKPVQLNLNEVVQQKSFIEFKSYVKENGVNLDDLLISYETDKYLKETVPLYSKNEVVNSFINYLVSVWR